MRLWSTVWLCGLVSAAALKRNETSAGLLGKCPGYTASNVQTNKAGLTADLALAGDACDAYGYDLKELTLSVVYESVNRIHVKIQDKENQVYQVPESVFPRPDDKGTTSGANIKFNYTEAPFSFRITRAGSGDEEVLFDTSAASLVFESQYLRLRTHLPEDPYLYGLGEHSDPFRLNTTGYIRTLWNQDSYGIPEGANLYSSQPFYLEHRKTGSHGVFLLNSNGMDVKIDNKDGKDQYLEYNTLGGVFDFWFFAGPSPIAVTQQYAEVAGLPTFQPYWGLGFHQCRQTDRYGYQDVFDVAEVVYNYSQAEIPLETMWTDIDYMHKRRVFSLDDERFPLHKMRQLVDHLHAQQQHYVVMVDPAVAYQPSDTLQRGLDDNVFLLRANGSVWVGVVWPGPTVFPDWFADNITRFWNNEFALFFDKDTGVDIDALWIDMNEPSNFACDFPCEDPYEQAVEKQNPPEPPPVREVPRPLPGWPCDFQPPGSDCKRNSSTTELVASKRRAPKQLPRDVKVDHAAPAERRAAGDQLGLPDRDLLYPKYSIHNKAAGDPSWNGDKGGLSNHTVNTDVMHQNGLASYDVHNLYGAQMSMASREALLARRPDKRPLIITRSTFAGTGHHVGKWLGDNLSTWAQYRASIRTLLAYTSLYQFPMTGSDVCGFGANTTEQLCARWAALGAFSPFFRNHNGLESVSQEFYRWPAVAASARRAIAIRYRLLDYLYTALHRAARDGTPVLHPTFYLYPADRAAWPLELQYFYGPGLLVAPVTDENATRVDVYLPRDVFYDWYTHELIAGQGALHTFRDQDVTSIPLLVRGGVILPLRVSAANTTAQLRTRDFELLIPLDAEGRAAGELYLDDGETLDVRGHYSLIEFRYEGGEVVIDGQFGFDAPVVISKVTVLGGGSAERDGRPSTTVDVHVSLNKASKIKLGQSLSV